MTSGEYLYDDDRAPLHTGAPHPRRGLLFALLTGTVVLAVVMVLGMGLFRGTPGEQAEEAAGVFLAALQDGDTATAHELLCAEELVRLTPDELAAEYLRPGAGRVTGSGRDDVEGRSAQRVQVRWDDGDATSLILVNEDGPRICGTAVTG